MKVTRSAKWRHDHAHDIELSVVMPCLNESDTLGTCIAKAQNAMKEHCIIGEIVIADNGSTDGSQQIAKSAGARVVNVTERGYGNALQGGIAAARGRFILMGDADDSYDFTEIPKFVDKLREGYDLVQGCRLPAGGGKIMPQAMPFLHRWWGNPAFSIMARWWFHAPIHDIYCGMRGFTRELYDRLGLNAPGMEFATEMIIQSCRSAARIAEVPITLHKDGRRSHPPHLKTFRDGWRTLRFFLLNSPRWLFIEPAKLLGALGVIGYAVALPGVSVGGIEFGLNTLMFSSLAILCAFQMFLFGLATKTIAVKTQSAPPDARMERFFRFATIERGLMIGGAMTLMGIVLLSGAVVQWTAGGFGHLNYDQSLRWVIPGATLAAAGVQTLFGGFFIGALSAFDRVRSRTAPVAHGGNVLSRVA